MSVEPGTRQIGEFIQQRQAIRTSRNPLDKATIVSIYPREFIEEKVTMQPGRFVVPAGSIENPSITFIGPSSWWKDVDYQQPLIEIPTAATVVAESVIKDFCNGLLGCNMGDEMPGLFYIPGEHTLSQVMMNYKEDLKKAEENQKRWYLRLINIADSLWSKAQNPLVIWDLMRVAASELQQDRPWMKTYNSMEMVKCFACGSLKDPGYPVCAACKVADPKHPLYAELKFAV